MRKKFLRFYKSQEPVTFWAVGLCAISTIVVLGLLLSNLSSLPPQLPLFYSQPWGEKQLVSLPQFLVLPSTIVIVTLINLVISWHLHTSQIVLKRMLALSSVMISLLIMITAFRIIYIFA